jgi:diguanylate cyclase (GGDEF)-like protein/excisionase family DNA binding protein
MARVHDDALLSVAQAATLLGVHPNTIRSWTKAGLLTAYRINARGDRRLRRSDVGRLLVEDDVAGAAERVGNAAEYAVFARLAEGLAAAPTVASVARSLVESLREELDLKRAAVYVAADGELTLAAHAGHAVPPPLHRAPDAGPTRDDVDAVIPLATPRTTVGCLVLDADDERSMSDEFLASLSATTATVIAAAQRLTRSRRELQRVRALRSVTKELTGTLDLTRVLDDVIERTRTMFAADRAGIWLSDDATHPVALVTRGLSDAFLRSSTELTRSSDTIAVRALRDARPHWMRDADRDPAVGEMRAAYASEGIRTVCVVPLVSRGESLGAIGLYHDGDRTWPDEELDLVQAFADQAAIAIQNARLYRSVAEQAARMRSIQDLSARLNRLTDVRAIAEAIVAEARTLADYHDIRIYRVDHQRGTCDPIAFTREMLVDDLGDPEDLLRVGIGEGFTGWVAEHGEPLLINDALDDERGKTIDGTDDVPESMLVVPMLYEGRALGVIVLSQLGYNRFTPDDLQTVSIFAGYAAQAMANADTYETLITQSSELARRAESQRRLLDINERLLTTLEPASVLETIADGLRDVVAYDNLSIYRTDDQRQAMLPVLARERHAEQVSRYIIPFGRGLMGWAVEHGQPILANDALNDPRALQIPGTPPDPEAVVVVPLIAEGAAIGALNVSRVGGSEVAFSDSDFELIQLFAAQASIALRNADTHHAMSQRADTDALTGLGNHGAFQRELGRAVDEATTGHATARPLSVLMMDLDNFKAYNDQYGHPAGDALLHRVATAIYGAARSEDEVYRYGGDEFALVVRSATSAQAARLADRVRRAVGMLSADDAHPVTITIGVATLPRDASDRPTLIAAADTALFYGKRAGGDRVIRADQLPEEMQGLRGTLEELASAALRDGHDEHAVEHLVERAAQLAAPQHAQHASTRHALLSVTRSLHGRSGSGRAHADRVGRLARTLAVSLGMDADDQQNVELAARLHAMDDLGVAELAAIPSLHEGASLIAEYRALLDAGSRRRRRIGRPRGRIGSHVVAAADIYDELITGRDDSRVGRNEALATLRAHPATLRSDVLDALAGTVNHRDDPGRRRRRSDAAGQEDRGAA